MPKQQWYSSGASSKSHTLGAPQAPTLSRARLWSRSAWEVTWEAHSSGACCISRQKHIGIERDCDYSFFSACLAVLFVQHRQHSLVVLVPAVLVPEPPWQLGIVLSFSGSAVSIRGLLPTNIICADG